MDKGDVNTIGANEFAKNTRHTVEDISINWWEALSNYRIKKWKRELKNLSRETGISLGEVCEYIGTDVSEYPGFFRKLPKKRETYIGIGMAYNRSEETINRWIVKYGAKRRLYAKDILEDLIWIYLINANCRGLTADINYYEEYESCKNKIENVYNIAQETSNIDDMDTVVLENDLKKIPYELEHAKLKEFVRENMEAFKTAYAKPRKHLKSYVAAMLSSLNKNKTKKRTWTLNSLRGYLDDSMINYLSGSDEIKYIPKNKRTHISICLALGMGVNEINEYLEMMGYFTLDGTDSEEGQLINILSKWEEEHTLQRKYKDKYFRGQKKIHLTLGDELKAVDEMLSMRVDIKETYKREQEAFSRDSTGGRVVKNMYLSD